MTTESSLVLDVAIIGCGIVGVQVGLGLIKRGIHVTLYEQASELREIGAGLGFMRPARECMKELDDRIVEVLDRIGLLSQKPPQWMDGITQEDVRLRPKDQLYDMEVVIPNLDIRLCHRAELLSELVKLLPPGVLRFGKRLEGLNQETSDGKVQMTFSDGQKIDADAVIGCDGLKSRVRAAVLDPDDPSARAHYAHESAYRCLVDMDKAYPVLGDVARTILLWTGNGAHIGTYPVANFKYLNVAAFVRDYDWPDESEQVVEGNLKDIVASFAEFGPAIQDLIKILPEKQSRWGMFDSLDHPLSTYAYGSVVLAGDAAHCSTPHHGYGASMGVEDALVLAGVLERAQEILRNNSDTTEKRGVLKAAFEAYDVVRRERSQWLVASSRRQGQLVKGEVPGIGRDRAEFVKDTRERVEKIFRFDGRSTVRHAVNTLDATITAMSETR